MRARAKQYRKWESQKETKKALMKAIGDCGDREMLERRCQEVFKEFDLDGNGKLDTNELQEALLKLGQKVTPEMVGDLVKDTDLDGDGFIDPEEWKQLVFGIFGFEIEAPSCNLDQATVDDAILGLREAFAEAGSLAISLAETGQPERAEEAGGLAVRIKASITLLAGEGLQGGAIPGFA